MMPVARGILLRVLLGSTLILFSSSEEAIYGNNHSSSMRPQANAGGGGQQESKFTLLSMANGVSSKDGAPFSQNTYGTPSGEKVYELIIHFDSPTGAKKELAYWTDRAIKIVDRRQVKGMSGTEERAVIIFSGKLCENATMIMETDKSILHQIQSCSAQTALDFEKEFKGKVKPVQPKTE